MNDDSGHDEAPEEAFVVLEDDVPELVREVIRLRTELAQHIGG